MEKKSVFLSDPAERNWPGLFLFGVLINRYGFGIPDTEALPRVMELVREGANVNARDHIRRTPAMRCCEGSGHHVILYFLIESGADLEATSIFSTTALHVATAANDFKCVILLLKQGVSVGIESAGLAKRLSGLHVIVAILLYPLFFWNMVRTRI